VRFDWWRGWEATPEWIAQNAAERSAPFNTVNRNKLDITLDLVSPTGAALFKRLVAVADAVVENYSAGVLPKLGLDYPALRAVNEELVMVSMPAFGANGPWRDYRAYGSTVEHASGLPHLSGNADWPPTMIHGAYGDAVGGLNGAAALLTALRHRRRTGECQHVDLSQSECLLPLGIHGILEQSVNGAAPPRLGNRSARYAPHGVYPARGDDQWVVIQVFGEDQWRASTELVPGLAAYGGRAQRLERAAALDAALAAWTHDIDAQALMQQLQEHGIACAKVQGAEHLLTHPHLVARQFWRRLERPFVGVQPHPLAPYRTNGAAYDIDSPAPTLGQHNQQVLADLPGPGAAAIVQLQKDGVIGDRPVMTQGSME
jgi:crotonobetainyl-CoA:carnitine CoA-transferase CaiB-like acyl-CoA transferase